MVFFSRNRFLNGINAFMSATGGGTNSDSPIINVFRNMNFNNWKLLNIDIVKTNVISSNTNSSIVFITKTAHNFGLLMGANMDINNWNINNVNIIYTNNIYPTSGNTISTNNNNFNVGQGQIYGNGFLSSTGGYSFHPTGIYVNTSAVINTTLNMNGNSIINCPSLGGSITGSNSISVNSGGVNFLSQSSSTVNNITMYGLDSSSFIIQNNASENCGMGLCSNQDNISFWTATDGNNFMSFIDEDVGTDRFGGINGSASIFVGSSKLRKHSIKEKNNNNVLNRIMKLKVCSYGLKYNIDDNDNEKKY